jgi:enamine deaminase RidA (YjgF/YER057c/UK114 family)
LAAKTNEVALEFMNQTDPNRMEQICARRDVLRCATLAAAGSFLLDSLAIADETAPPGNERKAVHAESAPAADIGYSPALLANGERVLFISGQGPKDRTADMETQIRQTFDKIGSLLKSAGASFANVVFVRTYWVHLQRDLATFRKVRRDYLVEPYPASTAVGVTELATPGLELEIEAVALL